MRGRQVSVLEGFQMGMDIGNKLKGSWDEYKRQGIMADELKKVGNTDLVQSTENDAAYARAEGLDPQGQQAAQLLEQDRQFGTQGARSTADALNYVNKAPINTPGTAMPPGAYDNQPAADGSTMQGGYQPRVADVQAAGGLQQNNYTQRGQTGAAYQRMAQEGLLTPEKWQELTGGLQRSDMVDMQLEQAKAAKSQSDYSNNLLKSWRDPNMSMDDKIGALTKQASGYATSGHTIGYTPNGDGSYSVSAIDPDTNRAITRKMTPDQIFQEAMAYRSPEAYTQYATQLAEQRQRDIENTRYDKKFDFDVNNAERNYNLTEKNNDRDYSLGVKRLNQSERGLGLQAAAQNKSTPWSDGIGGVYSVDKNGKFTPAVNAATGQPIQGKVPVAPDAYVNVTKPDPNNPEAQITQRVPRAQYEQQQLDKQANIAKIQAAYSAATNDAQRAKLKEIAARNGLALK